jgi:hypothetical protein
MIASPMRLRSEPDGTPDGGLACAGGEAVPMSAGSSPAVMLGAEAGRGCGSGTEPGAGPTLIGGGNAGAPIGGSGIYGPTSRDGRGRGSGTPASMPSASGGTGGALGA